MAISSHLFINCAGLDSDLMAAGAGLDIKKCGYCLHYCKGQYFRVSAKKASLVKRLVYPVPRPKGAGLGIHATVDLGAGLRLGPDDEYLKTREKNYEVDLTKRHAFFESVHRFLPFIEEQDLSADTSGIRPKLQGPGDDFRDFVIKEESDNGLPNFIDLIGIESPGFTASLAIARYVNKLIEKRMINTK